MSLPTPEYLQSWADLNEKLGFDLDGDYALCSDYLADILTEAELTVLIKEAIGAMLQLKGVDGNA